MREGACAKHFAPIWSRFLASRSLAVRLPCVRRSDRASCSDLIAILRRLGHAFGKHCRQALPCSSSPAGRIRAGPHGFVVRSRPTSLAAPAEARQRRPPPLGHSGSNLTALDACGRDIDVLEVTERRAGPPHSSVLESATPPAFTFAFLRRRPASQPSVCQRRNPRQRVACTLRPMSHPEKGLEGRGHH